MTIVEEGVSSIYAAPNTRGAVAEGGAVQRL